MKFSREVTIINPVIIINIIIFVLQLIASGMSESSAVNEAANIFGVSVDDIWNIMD